MVKKIIVMWSNIFNTIIPFKYNVKVMSKQEKVIKNLFIFLDPVIQCTIGLALDHLHF